MSKKSIFIASTFVAGCTASGLLGMVFGSRAALQVLTRSGLSMSNVPDAINVITKYEALGYGVTAASKQQNTSPETMLAFLAVSLDVLKDNNLMQDPRFQEVYVKHEFDGITKNLDFKEDDDA